MIAREATVGLAGGGVHGLVVAQNDPAQHGPGSRDALVRPTSGRAKDDGWTRGDVALVDEAQWRIAGVPRTYTHVIVDEVQDLSPMEVRMVGRRAATGAMTPEESVKWAAQQCEGIFDKWLHKA